MLPEHSASPAVQNELQYKLDNYKISKSVLKMMKPLRPVHTSRYCYSCSVDFSYSHKIRMINKSE